MVGSLINAMNTMKVVDDIDDICDLMEAQVLLNGKEEYMILYNAYHNKIENDSDAYDFIVETAKRYKRYLRLVPFVEAGYNSIVDNIKEFLQTYEKSTLVKGLEMAKEIDYTIIEALFAEQE